ncbi:retrovirus-related pol polyprotein from transposon TNT 1-94 [Tanacetum coccineum]
MARQCTKPKRPRNAAWFKEKAMLPEAQESGQILDEEQLAFLADLGILDRQGLRQPFQTNRYFKNNDLKAQLQAKNTTICKLKERIKSMRENNKEEKVKQEIDEIETINIELEHSQIQEKAFVTTSLQIELRSLKGKNVLDNASTITNATTIALGMFKLDIEPISHRLKNNRDAHEDYLKKTIENTNTIRGLVEHTRKQNPSEPLLDSSCKFTKHVQELLVYVSQTCPSFTKPSEKLVVVTPMNKVKKFRFSKTLTSSSNIHKQVESSKKPDFNTLVLPSTGLKSSTSASISQPTGNKKNDKISQTPSSNMKNKVEDHPRRVKSKTTLFIYLLSKASKTKSWLWHRRLSHLNFGKSNKSSHQPKAEDTNQEKLYLLHMDLCGLMRVESINLKKYILVIIDYYSRFTWVKFLRLKDEAPVTLQEFYENVGISHQTSLARTPQQNGVIERRNRTLVEAARTMLIFSKAPLFMWAKAINTACYTQNRFLIRLRYNKTPYELMHDKKLDLSFLYVFYSLCYPTNDSEDLGKLNVKADIAMASEQFSLGLGLQFMTPGTSRSGLVLNPVLQQPFNPPTRNDWEPDTPRVVDIVGSSSSTTIDLDAPSISSSSTNQQKQSSIISQGVEEPIPNAHFDDPCHEPLYDVSTSQESSSNMHSSHSLLELIVCLCARYQAKPTEKHLHAVKRIFRYLKGTIHMGLWYSKDTGMSLTAYSDADHAGAMQSNCWLQQVDLDNALEHTSSVVLNSLGLSPLYPTFLITAEVPEIYMHQFWHTITKIKNSSSYKFKLDKKHCKIDVEVFHNILQICLRLLNQEFDAPPSDEETVTFIKELGHKRYIKSVIDVVVDQMHQPWRTFASIINKCLSRKITDFVFQIDNGDHKKQEKMYYPRFTKVIIHHFISKDKSISMRNRIFMHIVHDDSVLGTLRFVSKSNQYQVYGALLSEGMSNQQMRDYPASHNYLCIRYRASNPSNPQLPLTPQKFTEILLLLLRRKL